MLFRSLNIFGAVLALGLVLLMGCSKGDAPRPDDVAAVRAIMEQRAQAIANKDIGAFERLLHDEYNDGRNTKSAIVEDMTEVFNRYQSLHLNYQKAPVELKMNTARVVQRLEYQVNDGERTVHDHEHLMLRKTPDGAWKISGGIKVGLL